MAILTTRFALGRLLIPPAAQGAIDAAGVDVLAYVQRHALGDWGELDDFDKGQQDYNLARHARLRSAYTLPTSVQIWLITKADRSVTTSMLPEDY